MHVLNNISETCLMYVSRIKNFFGHVCGGLVCLPTYLGCPKCLLIAKHEKVDETYYALTTLTNYLHTEYITYSIPARWDPIKEIPTLGVDLLSLKNPGKLK